MAQPPSRPGPVGLGCLIRVAAWWFFDGLSWPGVWVTGHRGVPETSPAPGKQARPQPGEMPREKTQVFTDTRGACYEHVSVSHRKRKKEALMPAATSQPGGRSVTRRVCGLLL